MNAQRLRNLTTGILHTKMEDIYEDVEYFTGEKGIMTHMLPNAFKAMRPWLKKRILDERFWDGEYDTTHLGDFIVEPMTPEEQKEFWKRYADLPSPLANLGAS